MNWKSVAQRWLARPWMHLVMAVSLTSLGGCSVVNHMIYKTTGTVMTAYAETHQVPYVLASDDLEMNCAMAQALTPLLMSFSRVTHTPDKLGVMVYLSAGMCAESQAWEEELRYLRAVRGGNGQEAQDAQIAQKRFHILAAQRNYTGYNHLVAEFGEPGGQSCPDLDTDFDNFIWLAGMLAGLQALSNEMSSGTALGIPKNIAAKAERGAACLDDDKFWGVPMAIRATVWSMLPGATPQGEDPFVRLKLAAEKGEKAGVRLPHVLYAMAAMNQGNTALVRDVIRQHATAKAKKPADPERKLLDAIATQTLQAMSDRLWTEHTGHRTPVGGLGTFWDDRRQSSGETIDLDDIL